MSGGHGLQGRSVDLALDNRTFNGGPHDAGDRCLRRTDSFPLKHSDCDYSVTDALHLG